TLVTKQLVARLAPPRFFVAGDEASLVSVVTNRDPAPVTGVEGSIEVAGAAALAGAASSRFDLPARGESRGQWSVRIPPEPPREGEDARFIFRARSKTDADALETRVPIKARAVAVTTRGASVAEGAREVLAVGLPAGLIRSGSEVVLDLSPSPAAMALAAADYLTTYPYGCPEQTA